MVCSGLCALFGAHLNACNEAFNELCYKEPAVGHADAWLDCIACDVIGARLLDLSKYKWPDTTGR